MRVGWGARREGWVGVPDVRVGWQWETGCGTGGTRREGYVGEPDVRVMWGNQT